MADQPIEISEQQVQAFAAQAARFYSSLGANEQGMWETILRRAGATRASGDTAGMTQALAGVWEPGTQIAPLYSGNMGETGYTD